MVLRGHLVAASNVRLEASPLDVDAEGHGRSLRGARFLISVAVAHPCTVAMEPVGAVSSPAQCPVVVSSMGAVGS